jgi:class 3 adenylate cyclase
VTDVAAWLRGLGLGQYEAAFRGNDVDATVLPSLTAEDLKEIGVASVGHRRRLLDAIAALRGSTGSAARGAEPVSEAPSTEAPPGAGGASHDADGHGAERRQLTVLFCDLAGSTALAARLDPEDLREVMATYHRAVAKVVERHGGYVAKLLGDGVLAYFGWPRAHEDDAERAVRAGLAAAEEVAGLQTSAGPLAARVGIATGPVVVGEVLGDGEARERGVVGETPNLAARLRALGDGGGGRALHGGPAGARGPARRGRTRPSRA